MTFSDQAVVDFLDTNFVCAWESVAPVKVVTFDLGNGKSVEGTISGEIALWFCRPDGTVFEVLPGLHSPAATLEVAREALAFYAETRATDEAIVEWHAKKLEERGQPAVRLGALPHRIELERRRAEADAATADLSTMVFSKVVMMDPEPVTVVEPGGMALFRFEVDTMLCAESAHRTPEDWKVYLFEEVLNQPLVGGHVTYDSSSLAPISIIEE